VVIPTRVNLLYLVAEWRLAEWQEAQVHLLPQLKNVELKEALLKSITTAKAI